MWRAFSSLGHALGSPALDTMCNERGKETTSIPPLSGMLQGSRANTLVEVCYFTLSHDWDQEYMGVQEDKLALSNHWHSDRPRDQMHTYESQVNYTTRHTRSYALVAPRVRTYEGRYTPQSSVALPPSPTEGLLHSPS